MDRTSVKSTLLIVLCVFLALVVSQTCFGCTVFCIDKGNQLIVGRNQDWYFGDGMAVVNKRGQSKTAVFSWGFYPQKPVRWVSKYGSVSFVSYGREFAICGMNEAGLVVHQLWMDGTEFCKEDSRSYLQAHQYVQFILDNFKSIDEIIESEKAVSVGGGADTFTKIHFFAVDSAGNSIAIDFISGKMVFHTKQSMPIKAITNSTYEQSLYYLNRMKTVTDTTDRTSISRFLTVANKIAAYKPKKGADTVQDAFDILDSVKMGDPFWTVFQFVFDVRNRKIYIKTLANPKLRYINLDSLDFSPQTPSRILDLNADLVGDVSANFRLYSTEANEDLIRKGWRSVGLVLPIYMPSLWLFSHYPDTFVIPGQSVARIEQPQFYDDYVASGKKVGTEFIEAARFDRTEILKPLIKAGIDLNERDYCDQTALIEAVSNGQTEAAKLLIEAGADVDLSNHYYGYTALMYAAHDGMTSTVKLLIEAKANVNLTNKEGKTALMIAAIEGQLEIVKILIAAGAEPNVNDKDGMTAVKWAVNEGHMDIMEILKEAGATE